MDSVDYPTGHKALYFSIKLDPGFVIGGFAGRFDISENANGEEIFQSGLEKGLGKEPKKLKESLEYARELLRDK